MITSAMVSALHLLALGIGLPSVFLRGRALKGPLDSAGLSRLFAADTVWGLAAGLWLITGLLRAFGGLEKGAQFYLASPLFWLKMSLLAAVLLLEIVPMITFVRWRARQRLGEAIETERVRMLYTINHAQLAIVVIMVFVASLMARGVGFG